MTKVLISGSVINLKHLMVEFKASEEYKTLKGYEEKYKGKEGSRYGVFAIKYSSKDIDHGWDVFWFLSRGLGSLYFTYVYFSKTNVNIRFFNKGQILRELKFEMNIISPYKMDDDFNEKYNSFGISLNNLFMNTSRTIIDENFELLKKEAK